MKRPLMAALPVFCTITTSLAADPAKPAAPAAEEKSASLWERDKLTGEWGGFRTRMAARGVTRRAGGEFAVAGCAGL